MILETLRQYSWLILVAAGFLLVLLAVSMKRFKNRPAAVLPQAAPAGALTPREQVERQNQVRGMGRDLEQLMADLEQMAQRVGAQLDAKGAELEKLLEESRQRIAQLEQLSGPAVTAPPPVEPAVLPAIAPPSEAETEPEDLVARDVYRLADSGHNSGQIASALNEHVGKVELILALRES